MPSFNPVTHVVVLHAQSLLPLACCSAEFSHVVLCGRVYRGGPATGQHAGEDPLLPRPTWRRQDQHCKVHRQGTQQEGERIKRSHLSLSHLFPQVIVEEHFES